MKTSSLWWEIRRLRAIKRNLKSKETFVNNRRTFLVPNWDLTDYQDPYLVPEWGFADLQDLFLVPSKGPEKMQKPFMVPKWAFTQIQSLFPGSGRDSVCL